MAKVKLNLRGLSALELIALARQIITAMTGNPDFPAPQPTLAQLTTATDELETAVGDMQTARQIAATKTSIKDETQETIIRILRQSAAYVESVSGDDQKMILGAGMGVRITGSPMQEATPPGDLIAREGDHEGEIDLQWDKVRGAKSYEIQRSADPPTATSWAHAAISAKSSATIGGLTSGTRYWFRVAAVTSGGQGGWSDPATKIAP